MSDDKRRLFQAHYEANLGKFPIDKPAVAGIWFDFIDTLAIELIPRLVSDVAEQWTKAAAPRVSVFRKHWREIRPRRMHDGRPMDVCGLCGGSGFLTYLSARYVDDDEQTRIAIADATKGPLHHRTTQCVCSKGDRMAAASKDAWPREDRQRVADWVASQEREAQTNGFELTWFDDSGQHARGDVRAYHNHLIERSKHNGQRENERDEALSGQDGDA